MRIVQANHMDWHSSYKIADGAFYPCLGRKWPTIALEVGYTASYEDLVRNAMLLIKGSNGGIGLVILVKLQPLKEDETEIQKGGLEVWGYEHKRKDCFRLEHQVSHCQYPRSGLDSNSLSNSIHALHIMQDRKSLCRGKICYVSTNKVSTPRKLRRPCLWIIYALTLTRL